MQYSSQISSKDCSTTKDTNGLMALQLCQAPSAHTAVVEQTLPHTLLASVKDVSQSQESIPTTTTETGDTGTTHSDIPHASRSEITSSRPPTLNIVEHPQADLLVMLSSLLTKITYSNDNIYSGPEPASPLKPGSPLLAFHARNIPSISIQSYLTRILKYCPMSSDIFLSLLVYFDRMSHSPSEDKSGRGSCLFTSTRQFMGDEHQPLSIDSYNVHRLVITGIVVASKFCSDVFYTNSRYAKVRQHKKSNKQGYWQC